MILYRYRYIPTGQYLFKVFKQIPAALNKTGKVYAERMVPFEPPVLMSQGPDAQDIQTLITDWEEEKVEVKVLSRTKLK